MALLGSIKHHWKELKTTPGQPGGFIVAKGGDSKSLVKLKDPHLFNLIFKLLLSK